MQKKNKIKIKLNGKVIQVNRGINLAILIDKLKFPLNKIAIEKNNLIVEKKKLLRGGEDLSSEDIDDFMKEVTNVCMGGIKKMFENEALFVSTSLPLVMRKKDSIFIDCDEDLDEVRVVHDVWNVTVNGVKITCELFFEVYNPQRFYSAISRKKIKDDSLKDEVIMFI